MKQIIKQDTVNALNKSKKYIYLIMTITFVIAISLMVIIIIFTNRKIRYLAALILAIIATLEASSIFYLIYASLIPTNNYLKFIKNSLSSNKYLTNALVLNINNKITHVRGISVKEIRVKDLNENKEYIFYVENNIDISDIKENQSYQFITYQSFITAYENL